MPLTRSKDWIFVTSLGARRKILILEVPRAQIYFCIKEIFVIKSVLEQNKYHIPENMRIKV